MANIPTGGFGSGIPDTNPEEKKISDRELFATDLVSESDKWEMVKNYWNERAGFYRRGLLDAVDANQDLKLIGEKYMISEQLARECEAFVNWVETTAEEARKREEVPEEDEA